MVSETQHLDDGTYDSTYMSFLQETVDVVSPDQGTEKKLLKKTTKRHQENLKKVEEEKKLEEQREYWKTELEETVRTQPEVLQTFFGPESSSDSFQD